MKTITKPSLKLTLKIFFKTKLARDSSQNLNCLTFVDINGQVTCDLNKIEDMLKNDQTIKMFHALSKVDLLEQIFQTCKKIT